MNFRTILIFTIVSIAILSCKNKEINIEPKIIDLSSFGSVNMIKEIGGEIFVLNATVSSIYKLTGDSLSLFRDLEIGGRDFLLDFDIEGDKVYYSNTYDEIFVSTGNTIEDTIKVFNSDRIAVIDSLLYATSRKTEDQNVLLKLYDIKSKKVFGCIPLNDSLITDMRFAQASIYESGNDLWVMNPFRNRLEKYNRELQLVSSLDLPQGYEYGNFSIYKNSIKIIASKDNSIYSITLNQNHKIITSIIKSEDIDIRSSCITQNGTFCYDYLSSRIIINLTK